MEIRKALFIYNYDSKDFILNNQCLASTFLKNVLKSLQKSKCDKILESLGFNWQQLKTNGLWATTEVKYNMNQYVQELNLTRDFDQNH